MNDVPVQIRNPEIARAIRELAAKKGQPITEAVGDLVIAELRRLEAMKEAEVQRKLAAVKRLVDEFNALPVIGPLLTDEDLYDENGFPK
jgi:hypothetical protein